MFDPRISWLLLAVSCIAATAHADDEARIRAEIAGYLEAWNAGDAEALASHYDADGDRANNRGQVFRGRETIHAHYERVFSAPPPEGVERRLVYHDVSVRLVAEHAAVVDIDYEVTGIASQLRPVRGRNTVFMIERGGRWMRAAHRNSLPLTPACVKLCSERDLLASPSDSGRALTDAELDDLGRRYAAAWSGQNPQALAAFYAENGSLTVNDGSPAVGREAIAAKAREFMTAFPDMLVVMDRMRRDGERTFFHWTWTGTNTGPGGNGRSVEIRGYEEWTLDGEGRILSSDGHYDEAEYARQMGEGAAEG